MQNSDYPTFDCLNDIEAWLEPLTYEAFWQAVKPHCVQLQPKQEYDALIADNVLSEEQVMTIIKRSVVMKLADRYNLEWEDRRPFMHA